MIDTRPYYLQNFERLTTHATTLYADLLSGEESARLAQFQRLPEPSRNLFVRVLTRSAPQPRSDRGFHGHKWLRSDKLVYTEVGDCMTAAQPLIAHGFIRCDAAIDAATLLTLMTDAELRPLAAGLGIARTLAAAARRAAIDALLPDFMLRAWLRQYFLWLRPANTQWIDTLMLLYFGNRRQDLSTFVVAELGHVRYEVVPYESQRPFSDRADFECFRTLLDLRQSARVSAWRGNTRALLSVSNAVLEAPDHVLLPGRRDRMLVLLAETFSKLGLYQSGIAVCSAADSPEAQRRMSLLRMRVPSVLRSAEVGDGHEQSPAVSPIRRKAALFRPPERSFSLAWRPGEVEAQTLAVLTGQGYRGAHLENAFPTALFGLLCWDVVFAALPGAFFNAYQIGPADLDSADFHARRFERFKSRIDAIRNGSEDWRQRAASTHLHKHGIANPFVHWRDIDWPLFFDLCAGLRDEAAAMICEHIALDPRRHRVGFPDLSLRQADAPTVFCEVKSPNDQLHPAQRRWLQQLDQVGHHAWVARILAAPDLERDLDTDSDADSDARA